MLVKKSKMIKIIKISKMTKMIKTYNMTKIIKTSKMIIEIIQTFKFLSFKFIFIFANIFQK
jgi:hypothetical protein